MSKLDVKSLISALKNLDKSNSRPLSKKNRPKQVRSKTSPSITTKTAKANYNSLTHIYKGSKKTLRPTDDRRILLDLKGNKKNNKICLYVRGNDPELVFRTYIYTTTNDVNSEALAEKVEKLTTYLESVSTAISDLLPHSLRTGPLGEVVPSATISTGNSNEDYKIRLNRSFIKQDRKSIPETSSSTTDA